jgi:hypothetical protein
MGLPALSFMADPGVSPQRLISCSEIPEGSTPLGDVVNTWLEQSGPAQLNQMLTVDHKLPSDLGGSQLLASSVHSKQRSLPDPEVCSSWS